LLERRKRVLLLKPEKRKECKDTHGRRRIYLVEKNSKGGGDCWKNGIERHKSPFGNALPLEGGSVLDRGKMGNCLRKV